MWHLIISSQMNIDLLKRMEKYLNSKIQKIDVLSDNSNYKILLLDTENKNKDIAEAFAAVFLSYYKKNYFEKFCNFSFLSDRLNFALRTSLCYFDNEYEFNEIIKGYEDTGELNIDGWINFKLQNVIQAWADNIEVIEDSVYAGISRDKIIDLIAFLIESRRTHKGKILVLEEGDGVVILTGAYKLIKKIIPFNENELFDILVKLMPKEIIIGKISCDKNFIDFIEDVFSGKITFNASSNKILNFTDIAENLNYF